jgi:ATP-binding cassette, subfamily B (MDR/TAP), member 7
MNVLKARLRSLNISSGVCSQPARYRLFSLQTHHFSRPLSLSSRGFQHLAQNTSLKNQDKSKIPGANASKSPRSSSVQELVPNEDISSAEQRRRDLRIVRQLVRHIWPKNDWNTKARVVFGVGLLVGGKVCLSLMLVKM